MPMENVPDSFEYFHHIVLILFATFESLASAGKHFQLQPSYGELVERWTATCSRPNHMTDEILLSF